MLTEDKQALVESERYLSEQIITYLGNKRALLSFIGGAVESVKLRLGKDRLHMVDLFSGSGIVARYMKQHASYLVANDLEDYSFTANRCYLSNAAERDETAIRHFLNRLHHQIGEGWRDGFIAALYAPQDDAQIRPGERVFYTSRNARYIDTARQILEDFPDDIKPYLLAPLLAEASVKSNTSGVFKGFYKNRETGIGQFGGSNQDALSRIKADIRISYPVFSHFSCAYDVLKEDANALAGQLETADLVYLDPPYNQHPYGSNYFMLNLINSYVAPESFSEVSGIPKDWNRSNYNKRALAAESFAQLVSRLRARYLLVSYNSEGFISFDDMMRILSQVGYVEPMETQYNAFRGSRNLRNRNIHTKEYLFLVSKGSKGHG